MSGRKNLQSQVFKLSARVSFLTVSRRRPHIFLLDDKEAFGVGGEFDHGIFASLAGRTDFLL
jgi:hypothetical protein